MVRFIGGRFGNNVSAPGGGASPPSVYTSRDQWWMQKASSWPNYIETTGITASGGTKITPGNGYIYHFFTSTGAFTVNTKSPNAPSNTLDYIIIAGGGSGGGEYSGPNQCCGGGGGAGGYRTGSYPFTNTTYPVTIGAGGPVPAAGRNPGSRGGNSVAFSITSTGGGGGGHYPGGTVDPAAPGGSGGGGGRRGGSSAYGSGNTPPVSPPQGNDGGYGEAPPSPGYDAGGGGGGAGGVGTPTYPGNGGVGIAAFSGDTGIPPSYGTPGPSAGRWFAGGGGGGMFGSGTGGAGGGAGAPGSVPLPDSAHGQAATVSTGGGGSGGRSGTGPAPDASGGQGGSGIVIVRYLA